MSILDQIAFFQNRRDEVPNQALARHLAETKDSAGIQEIAENLWNKNQNVRSDCLKVLYEIGYLDPGLIAVYAPDFLKLLQDKNNRMVWGGMIALATIAPLKAGQIWEAIDEVIRITQSGTLISQVWGVKTLSGVASTRAEYRQRLLPWLMDFIKTCPPRDLPMHAESVLCALDEQSQMEFVAVLEARQSELKPTQITRLNKVIKQLRLRSKG
jgi:hypothetical protein